VERLDHGAEQRQHLGIEGERDMGGYVGIPLSEGITGADFRGRGSDGEVGGS